MDFHVFGVSPLKQVIVVGVTLAVVVLAILTHFEALSFLTSWVPKLQMHSRIRVATLVICLLLVHVFEIWLFALGYYLTVTPLHLGLIKGPNEHGVLDFVYYSAVVYTSLGFGDMIPSATLRFMTAIESLLGLIMIGWSTSFIYLEMREFWNKKDAPYHKK